MSNLLPIPAQREVTRLHRARLAFVTSVLLASTAVVAGIILLPSHLIIEKRQASLEASMALLKAPAANRTDRDLLDRVQVRANVLEPLLASTSTPSETITAALSLRPAGVLIDHISYITGKNTSVLLSGEAKAIDQVSVYQRALAGSGQFVGVSVPVGALAGVDDGRFRVTITSQ